MDVASGEAGSHENVAAGRRGGKKEEREEIGKVLFSPSAQSLLVNYFNLHNYLSPLCARDLRK